MWNKVIDDWKTPVEYIDREAANLALAEQGFDWDKAKTGSCERAADVVPVVHGKWIRPHWKNSDYCCDCSECGGEAMHREYQWNKKGIYPICPNCGAKMGGGAGNG